MVVYVGKDANVAGHLLAVGGTFGTIQGFVAVANDRGREVTYEDGKLA